MEMQENNIDQLYGELRRMAGSFMRHERPGHTLQPTALANEVYLSVGGSSSRWQNTGHYFGAAAHAMRQILIQYARGRRAQKRGGLAQRVTLEEGQAPVHGGDRHADSLHDALHALGEHDPALRRLVDLRYFSGYTLDEIASMTGRSLASVKRDWNYARAWLYEYLSR